jgi:YbbR domain-containing protein
MSDGRRSFTLFLKHIVRKIFFEDWLTKLVALAVTLALWLGVTGLSKPTTTRLTAVPLSLRYSSDTEVTNSPISEIDVIISGDNRKIAQINKNDLVASVDLTSLLPGDRVIQLTPENIQLQLPLGVRLDEITPGRMAVRLEAVEEKDLNVKIESTGKLADGFEVYSQAAIPGKVRVRGPVSLTKTLTDVSTEKVDLSDRKADFVARQVALTPPNGKLTLLDAAVDVNFRIGERRVERLFVVPVADGSNRRVSVVLYGPLTLLRELKSSELTATVAKNDAGTDTAQVNLPAELQGVVEIRRTRIV